MIQAVKHQLEWILTGFVLGFLLLIVSCKQEQIPTLANAATIPESIGVHNGTRLPNTWTPAPTRKFESSTRQLVTITQRPSHTPWPTSTDITPSLTPTPLDTPTITPTNLPSIFSSPSVSPSPTATPFSPIEMVVAYPADLRQIGENLNASGLSLAYSKIGFHVSIGGDMEGLSEWMRQLDAAGIPFFLKSVDYAGPIYEAQQLAKASGVPHTLVYRSSADLPNYDLSPEEAALEHWNKHMELLPPELDRRVVWLETVNEIDKGRSEWQARFSIATARLSLADGFRWAAFGWSTGEPEVYDWETPAMLFFLRMVSMHLDRLAIALHEYSGTTTNIAFEYPDRIGRFMQLFDVCDRHNIPRPTVLITEWGWTYNRVPPVNQSMADVAWAAKLYAPFPQVKGAAIWHLGGGVTFGNIADPAQKLIEPVTDFTLTHYYIVPPYWVGASADPDLYQP